MLINGERALAYVVRINDIQPIEGADRIELVKVGGWNVVAQKGLYSTGDLAVYCEIDSWIPHTVAPFLTQDGHYPKVFNEVEGQRLKTKRLRGVYSQGLLLPLQQSSYNDMALIDWFTVSHEDNDGCPAVREGDDVTELLGIQKWEKPLPAELRGLAKGNFPGFIPKTDQERVQNLTRYLPGYVGKCFEVTEKLHGSSMTVYCQEKYEDPHTYLSFGVCSRNINLKETDTNTYWKVANDQKLFDILRKMYDYSGHCYALQGEMIGEGINGNMYGIKGHMFKLFDIYDITDGRYLNPIERHIYWCQVCREGDEYHVPILNSVFDFEEFHTVDQLLKMVEHKSTLNPKVWSEGWVMKCHSDGHSFKVVSNKFLTDQDKDA